MRQDEEFTPLRVVRKNIMDFDRCAYRVYKSPTEYITVDAATALEAFRESGIKNPLRIVRETRFMERLIDQDKFTDVEEIVETGLVMEPPSEVAGHQEAVPRVTEAQAAPAPVQESVMAAAADPQPPVMDVAQPEEAEPVDGELSEDEVAKLLGQGGAAENGE